MNNVMEDVNRPSSKERKHRRSQRGQSLVEFALIVPMLLILVFGIIDFGMGLRAYISVATATREGARYAVVGNPPGTFTSGGSGQCNGTTTNTTVGKVCETINGLTLANLQSVTVEICTTASPPVCSTAPAPPYPVDESIRVTATYRYHYITPVKALVNFVSAGALTDYLTISSSTEMRVE
jgi:Flp pilus assembly protein TadG